ncbi:TPA: hypothetical protein HA259_03385 [Thermoplasmata archaeon]|nr:hypothetical protein [Thermoplasmata archaeon]
MPGQKEAGVPTLKSALISYIIAQGDKETAKANLPQLQKFLKRQGIANESLESLHRLMERERRELDSVESSEKVLAKLFRKDGVPIPPKHRRGSPFCSGCGMYKDHSKECPICGKLEITL